MEDCCECDPEEIRDVGVYDPSVGGRSGFNVKFEAENVNGDKRPDERAEDEKDIYRREEIIFEAELEGGEDEVEDEVEGKWQSNHPWDLPRESFVKNSAERYGNDRIQNGPNRPKDPSRRRPSGLNQLRVPRVTIHPPILHLPTSRLPYSSAE